MNIVIVGYGNMFQSLIKAVLATKHKLVGVFRQENTTLSPLKKFFKDKYAPSDDYKFILKNKLTEIKANSVNSDEFRAFLKANKVDVVLVGSWHEKFSTQTINVPRKACINVHPSLLPKYRGPNPYFQTIIHGETITGVTFHLMDVNYDTGAILHQKEVNIFPDDTGETLKSRCCTTAGKELKFLLEHFETKLKYPISQNELYATYQPQIHLSDSILDFTKETSEQIDRRIRALKPWLKCNICYKNEFLTFNNYKIYSRVLNKKPSLIVKKTDNTIFIVCKDGRVMGFSGLQLRRPFANLLTKLYLNNIVKVDTEAN